MFLSIPCFSQVDKTIEREMNSWKESINGIRLYENFNKQDTISPFEYKNIVRLSKQPNTFIDTIQVRVLLFDEEIEPKWHNQRVFLRTCFMERKGKLIEYNSNTSQFLVYSPAYMKEVNETKIFYYATIPLIIGRDASEFFNSDGTIKKIEVEIPKKHILEIYPIK